MKSCRILSFFFLLSLLQFQLGAKETYLKKTPPQPRSGFDCLLTGIRESRKISPAREASDTVMVRRLYIDLCGRVPTGKETLDYLHTPQADKQARLVEKLLKSEEFAMFWAMRFGDELRIKSEFPINLWPNGTFAYTKVIYDFLRNNTPYHEFARSILLAQGSNFRNGYVNFFRAVPQKDTENIANAVTLFFAGKPLNKTDQKFADNIRQIFSELRFKSTREWKEEIVYLDNPLFDNRQAFYEILLDPQCSFFTETVVRRTWRWLFGNIPPEQEIVTYLAATFRMSNYDLRKLVRDICTSTAYRSGSIPADKNYTAAAAAGAVYPARRLDAEVLADSIAQITGSPYTYSSVIPEPFSYFHSRAAALTDGSVTDQFLILFGRPSRDSGLPEERKSVINADQRMFLFNSGGLHNKLNNLLRNRINREKDPLATLTMLFYSRRPTDAERNEFNTLSKKYGRHKVTASLAWVFMNSKEFLYQH